MKATNWTHGKRGHKRDVKLASVGASVAQTTGPAAVDTQAAGHQVDFHLEDLDTLERLTVTMTPDEARNLVDRIQARLDWVANQVRTLNARQAAEQEGGQ